MKKILLVSALSFVCTGSYAQSAHPATPSDQPVQVPPAKYRQTTTATEAAPATPSASPVDVTKAKRPAKQASASSPMTVVLPSQSPTPTSNRNTAEPSKARKE